MVRCDLLMLICLVDVRHRSISLLLRAHYFEILFGAQSSNSLAAFLVVGRKLYSGAFFEVRKTKDDRPTSSIYHETTDD
jgi:hypothetical protein